MTMVVTEPCVGCKHKDCVAVCPVDSFHEGKEMMFIDPTNCIDCEACISECPVEAIFAEANVPAKWQHFIALNAEGAKRYPVAREMIFFNSVSVPTRRPSAGADRRAKRSRESRAIARHR